MEAKGFNLMRIGKFVGFHFVKDEPRKIKYHIDYQRKFDPSYFAFHNESGWKLVFTPSRRANQFAVWAQEYVSEPPLFYNDKQSILKHAKKFALSYFFVSFAYSSAGLTSLIMSFIRIIVFENIYLKEMFAAYIPTFFIVAFIYAFLGVKLIRYCRRVKKSLEDKTDDNNS